MGVIQFVLGILGGTVVGALGCIVYAGPLDMPVVGLLLAAVIVASGAWFLLEWGKRTAWVGYIIAVSAVTVYLLMMGNGNDGVVVPSMWPSEVWLIVAPVMTILPAILVRRRPGVPPQDQPGAQSFGQPGAPKHR